VNEVMPFPDKKYNVIYADPPWSYEDKAKSGNRGAGFKYKTQSTEWVKSLPIKSITDGDCVLFLWVPMPKLNECFDVINAWGFEYKTCAFTWIKRTKKAAAYFWGMGSWTRANAELCLLATKGQPRRISAGVHSVIDWKVGNHSEKPPVVRDKIVELCGDLPRIELFARREKTLIDNGSFDGWDVWGSQC